MKVALELQPCCGNRSGIGVYTYELARRMENGDGLEFVGNLFNFLGRNDNRDALAGIPMPVRTCRAMPYGVYRRIWHALPLSYGMMFPKAELSIFFNYIVPPRLKGKAITTVHDLTFLRYPETLNRSNLRRLRAGLSYSLERSDRILTVSEFSKREIAALLSVPEEKISVVYNAPSLTDDTVPFSSLQEKYALRRPYLLYVGTIEPRKNLVRLLEAFQQLKSEHGIAHQLVLAGGNGWANGEIYQTARSLPCRDQIIFTGYVSSAEKNTLYANASAFVFPSIYEGFGIPPLEAMHFGCPVICADAASLPEVVGEAAELVDPLDVASIRQGIWRVLSSTEHAQHLVRLGREQVQKFTWDASARRLTELCHQVLGGS